MAFWFVKFWLWRSEMKPSGQDVTLWDTKKTNYDTFLWAVHYGWFSDCHECTLCPLWWALSRSCLWDDTGDKQECWVKYSVTWHHHMSTHFSLNYNHISLSRFSYAQRYSYMDMDEAFCLYSYFHLVCICAQLLKVYRFGWNRAVPLEIGVLCISSGTRP